MSADLRSKTLVLRRKAVRLALALLLSSAGPAMAAGPTAHDYRYLQLEYGVARDSDVITSMTPADRAKLHELIHGLKGDPAGRDEAVRNHLYDTYARECDAWAREHGGDDCRPANDPTIQPGKQIADRICAQCHLFGSGMAPAFFRLARRKSWDATALAGALQHSHDMVPITLPAEERDRLAAYINSFR